MRRALLLFAVFVATLAACDRTEADDGRDAAIQVADAQFFRGEMPGGDGPSVREVSAAPRVAAGASGRTWNGSLDPRATAVAIGLAGDVGYWVLPARVPALAAPGLPTFKAEVSFSAKLSGTRDVLVRAVDGDRRFGPATVRPVTIVSSIPEGRLVVSLAWDDRADLDLHVVDPNGVEIFDRNPSSYEPPPPGSPPEPPGTTHDGGVLDFDSNAQCVQDGRRREDVVWSDPPPKGHYLVRVETSALCGEAAARWRVEASLDGRRIGGAQGQSTAFDTRPPHGRGAGLLVLEFDVP
jgi:hypothetical protein